MEGLGLDLELIGELGRRVAQDQALRSAVVRDLPTAPSEALVARLAQTDADKLLGYGRCCDSVDGRGDPR